MLAPFQLLLPRSRNNSNLQCFLSCLSISQFPSDFLSPQAFRSLMAPPKMVAEYAKSNRSSCKECSKQIPSASLRLGLVSRDARGFEATKWHHLDCFSRDSQTIFDAEKIKGFSSLKVGCLGTSFSGLVLFLEFD